MIHKKIDIISSDYIKKLPKLPNFSARLPKLPDFCPKLPKLPDKIPISYQTGY